MDLYGRHFQPRQDKDDEGATKPYTIRTCLAVHVHEWVNHRKRNLKPAFVSGIRDVHAAEVRVDLILFVKLSAYMNFYLIGSVIGGVCLTLNFNILCCCLLFSFIAVDDR